LIFFESCLEIFIIVGGNGINGGENDRFDLPESWEWLGARAFVQSNRVSCPHIRDSFDTGDDIPHFTRGKGVPLFPLKQEMSYFLNSVCCRVENKTNDIPTSDRTFHNPAVDDGSPESIVMGVEYQCRQRGLGIPFRWWDALDDGFKNVLDADPCLGGTLQMFL